ncbi:threonine/serine exporter family protein [Catonella morbi]|nr:threonine/serine exporter family protein [Catonella morbi]
MMKLNKINAENNNDPGSKRHEWEERLALVLDIAEQMVISGAEVARTEYSVRRICKSFGAVRTEALSITTSLIVTVYYDEYGSVTQTRRVDKFAYNMDRLEKMNELSREICDKKLSIEDGRKRFSELMAEKYYSFHTQILFFMLIAFTFTLFFGGSIKDALVSSFIAIIFKYIDEFARKIEINKFIPIVASSLLGGFLAIMAVRAGLADSVGKVSIGDVMLLIPGIMLTNSLRDMFGGDTITGGIRFIEATLIAIMIAVGFSASSKFYEEIFSSVVVSTVREWPAWITIITALVTSFFGSIGYACTFNIRAKRLVAAGFGGLIGWAAYLIAGCFMFSEPMKYFVAALVINIYAEIMAVTEKAPSTVFLVSAIMPLVPGGMLYRTMRFAVTKEWGDFGKLGVETLSIALALALGMLIANSVIKSMRKRRRKRLGMQA